MRLISGLTAAKCILQLFHFDSYEVKGMITVTYQYNAPALAIKQLMLVFTAVVQSVWPWLKHSALHGHRFEHHLVSIFFFSPWRDPDEALCLLPEGRRWIPLRLS